LLGPTEKGVLTALILWPTLIVAIGGLSLGESVTVHLSGAYATRGAILGSAALMVGVLSVALSSTGLILMPAVFTHMGAQYGEVALLAVLLVPLGLITSLAMAVLRADQRFREYNFVRTSVMLAFALALVPFALRPPLTVESALLAWLAANLITTALAVWLTARSRTSWRYERPVARSLSLFSLKSHASVVGGQLNERADQSLMSIFLPPATLGLYAVASTVTSLHALVAHSVSIGLLPTMANNQGRAERLGSSVRFVLVVALVMSIGLTLLVPNVLPLVFGDQFEGAVLPAQILAIAAFFLSIGRTLQAGLVGAGSPWVASRAQVITLLVTAIGLAILLIPYRATGAALVSLVSYATLACLLLVSASVLFKIRVLDLIRPRSSDFRR
jgi:O-antigen/teichoic acid export membrane protein